jgi:hypothetical protein
MNLRSRSVIRFVGIETADEQKYGPAFRRHLTFRDTEVCLDRYALIARRNVGVSEGDLDRNIRRAEVSSALEIRRFAAFPCQLRQL